MDGRRRRLGAGLILSSISGVWEPFSVLGEGDVLNANRERDRVVRRGGDVRELDTWSNSLDVSLDIREDRILVI